MAHFNEDNVPEQMCIQMAQKAEYTYQKTDTLRENRSTVIVDSILRQTLTWIDYTNDEETQIVVQKVESCMGGEIVTAN